MKLAIIMALAFFAPLLFLSTVPAEKKMTIQDAVKSRQATVSVVSKGGHSGSCLSLTVANTSGQKAIFMIPPGTVFKAADEGEQDIFVVKAQLITLNAAQKKTIDASGFCCQLHDRSPGSGSAFNVDITSNEKLKKLAEHINQGSYPADVYQEAIWCVSDGNPVSNIYAEGEAAEKAVKPLKDFICQLTGQKEAWYSTQQNRTLTPEREIVSQPVKVKGDLEYKTTKGEQLRRDVVGPDGKVIDELGYSSVSPMTGTLTYGFQLEVEGWDKGVYKVIVSANKKVLLEQEFEI
jgi:hypothetical protein